MDLTGQVVAGKYRIEGRLGEGAMGVVYRANQLNLDRPVAVKFMQPEFARREQAQMRFEREARVSAALNHPNAVRIADFGAHEGLLYLVMEYLEGHTLDQFAPPGQVALEDALEIARQVASVLVAAHDIRLVHRDLKPENIFVEGTADGSLRVRVVDFGLAFIAGDEGANLKMGRLTGEGILGGTPAYMAPEQAQGQPVGPAADIYALGCVLYELISGDPPFDGTVAELLTKHVYEHPVALRERCPDRSISADLDALVMDMLSKSAAHRPEARQLQDRLSDLGSSDAERARRAQDSAYVGPRSERAVRSRAHGAADTLALPPEAGPAAATARTLATDEIPPGPPVERELQLAWAGTPDSAFLLALAANGVGVRSLGDVGPTDGDEAAAVFAPGATAEEIAGHAAGGLPVVSDTDPGDLPRIVAMLRAGAADLVAHPVEPSELARKVKRAVRQAKRRRRNA